MSTPQPPVGRRSPAVYRRRRLMVLLVLVAIVVLVVLALVRPWRGSAGPRSAPSSVPAAATTPSPTASAPSPAASATGSPTASAAPSVTSTATPAAKPTTAAASAATPCDPASIDVQAITDASRYSRTQRPLVSLSITNTGSQMCTIDAGTAAMVFTISSGSDQWWTSTDCQTNPVHTVIKLEPHKTLASVPIAWDRTRSSKTTCASKSRPQAPAGGASYHLSVAIDGIASKTSKQFLLE